MNSSQKDCWDKKYATQGVLWARDHDNWFEVGKNDLILDLGGGSGKSSRSIRGTVIALDFSRIALKKAMEFKSAPTDCVCGDAVNLPFVDEAFDLVRISFLLDHLLEDQRKKTVLEAHRVARKGGLIFIESFSTEDARCIRRNENKNRDIIDGDGILHHYFNKDEVMALVQNLTDIEMKEIEWRQRVGPGEFMKRSVIQLACRKR